MDIKISAMEAFTQLYEQWPMTAEYREQAWQVLRKAISETVVKTPENR